MIDECKSLKVRLGDELPPLPSASNKTPVGKGSKPSSRGTAKR
jgi:hypothetical protein